MTSQPANQRRRSKLIRRAKYYWRRVRSYVVFNVLHADDPPHTLALGIAIGVFVTFTPTIGAQMLLVLLLAWALRANKAVGLPIVWISNPVSMVPIFWACYAVGVKVLGQESVDAAWWTELANPPASWLLLVQFFWQRFLEIASPLWLGSLVVASGLAIPSYFLSRWGITKYRMARWGQLTPPRYDVPHHHHPHLHPHPHGHEQRHLASDAQRIDDHPAEVAKSVLVNSSAENG